MKKTCLSARYASSFMSLRNALVFVTFVMVLDGNLQPFACTPLSLPFLRMCVLDRSISTINISMESEAAIERIMYNARLPRESFGSSLGEEEIATTTLSATTTYRWRITFFSLHLCGIFVGDLATLHLILVEVVKGQLRPCGDELFSEEGKLVKVRVVMVVGDGEEGTVRLAGMVHEACRSTHVHAVTDVLGVLELVKVHEVVVLVRALLPLVGLFGRDDLAPVRVQELALLQILVAPQTPSALLGLEDIQTDFPAPLDDAVLAIVAAVTSGIAFEYVPAVLKDLLHQTSLPKAAVGVLTSLDLTFPVGVFEAAAFIWILALVASTFPAAFAADHDVFRSSVDAFLQLAFFEETKAGWRRAVVNGV